MRLGAIAFTTPLGPVFDRLLGRLLFRLLGGRLGALRSTESALGSPGRSSARRSIATVVAIAVRPPLNAV
jgi:ABC-type transport system involved in Fe-S cluster assembly fused permease/ATPase subunit